MQILCVTLCRILQIRLVAILFLGAVGEVAGITESGNDV